MRMEKFTQGASLESRHRFMIKVRLSLCALRMLCICCRRRCRHTYPEKGQLAAFQYPSQTVNPPLWWGKLHQHWRPVVSSCGVFACPDASCQPRDMQRCTSHCSCSVCNGCLPWDVGMYERRQVVPGPRQGLKKGVLWAVRGAR